jgi:hypothetical protein
MQENTLLPPPRILQPHNRQKLMNDLKKKPFQLGFSVSDFEDTLSTEVFKIFCNI